MVISKRRAWRTLTGSTQQANRRNTAMESDLSRRDFLRNAAKTTAGLSTLSGITFLAHPERVFGANDRVRVAGPGLYARCNRQISAFLHLPDLARSTILDV